jgi:serine/threonine-protein kinase
MGEAEPTPTPLPQDPARRLWALWQQGPPPEVRAFVAAAGPLSAAQLAAVLLVDQRERWQRGERILAEAYLEEYPALRADPEGAVEMVYGEFLLAEERGEAPRLEDYGRRFPALAARLALQVQLHRALESSGGSGTAGALPSTALTGPPSGVADDRPSRWPVLPDYEILGELGRGGMGTVYKARQGRLNRLVALKTLRAGLADDAEAQARFRREAEAVARLQHPHIVQIHAIGGEEGPCPYLALEFVAGGSLTNRFAGAPQPPREAARLVAVVAEALHFAHERHIVHRDLKPANVLLAEDGTPKVTDFGLAKELGDPQGQTRTGAVLGTPSYMAPEQAEGRKDVGVPADVYALGAILYELLTGRPPFRGATPLDTLEQVRTQEPVPPRRLQPKVPRDLEVICLKCLEKEPRHRYASAAALAEDLGRFRASQPIRARPASVWERLWKWARRRPAQAALVGVTVAAVVAVLAVVLVGNVRLREQRNLAEERRRQAVANLKMARAAVDRLLTQVSTEKLRDVPQLEPIAHPLLEDALELYKGIQRQSGDDPEVVQETAHAYRRLAGLYRWLGKLDEAESCCRDGLALLDGLPAEVAATPPFRREWAQTARQLVVVRKTRGKPDEAMDLLGKILPIVEELRREHPEDVDFQVDLLVLYTDRSGVWDDKGALHEEEADLRKALGLIDDLVRRFPDATDYQVKRALIRINLGNLLLRTNRVAGAGELFRRNRDLYTALASRYPKVVDYRAKLSLTLVNLADVYEAEGRPLEAEEVCRQAVALTTRLTEDFPLSPHWQYALGGRLGDLAAAVERLGDLGEAREVFEQSVAAFGAACRMAPKMPGYFEACRDRTADLVELLLRQEDHAEAARRAEQFPALHPATWKERLQAGAWLARCAALAENDQRLAGDRRSEVADDYARRAVQLLREGIQGEAAEVDFLNTDPNLAVLRSRPDFRKLVDERRNGPDAVRRTAPQKEGGSP